MGSNPIVDVPNAYVFGFVALKENCIHHKQEWDKCRFYNMWYNVDVLKRKKFFDKYYTEW